MRGIAAIISSSVFLLASACGGSNSTPPVSPSPVVNEVRVGVAGAGRTVVEPGKTAQLYAQAMMSDGTTQDVTNIALWQTSNPAVAMVSPTALVTTYLEGEVTITATYVKPGTIVLQVKEECAYTLDPAAYDSDAFGGRTVHVNVTATLSSCGWTVRSSVTWVRLLSATSFTGSGGFDYSLTGNSTPEPRSTDLTVSGDGTSATHRITQARPSSCSYVVNPEEAVVGLGGGAGSFRVDTTPDGCQWKAFATGSLSVLNASSYTPTAGDYTVQYRAYSATAGAEATISICGLSGTNPCGVFTVRWRN